MVRPQRHSALRRQREPRTAGVDRTRPRSSPTSTSTTARWDARSSSKTASNARSSIGSRCGNVSSKRAFSTEPAGTRETRRVPVSSAPRAFVTNALGAFRKILPDADELPKRTETDFSRRYSLQTFSPQPMIFSAGCGLVAFRFCRKTTNHARRHNKMIPFFSAEHPIFPISPLFRQRRRYALRTKCERACFCLRLIRLWLTPRILAPGKMQINLLSRPTFSYLWLTP